VATDDKNTNISLSGYIPIDWSQLGYAGADLPAPPPLPKTEPRLGDGVPCPHCEYGTRDDVGNCNICRRFCGWGK
jgi:hypothetical protein